ncbi:MAG: DegV family protein [Chloroflexota bacterium]
MADRLAKVGIMTDSGCDLDRSLCNAIGVIQLPILVTLGNETYGDRDDMPPHEFYQRIAADRTLVPRTSQIPPASFITTFEAALREHEELIYIAFSSGLSGTYESACLARAAVAADRIEVIDSLAASVGQGLIVLAAAAMADRGESRARIADAVRFLSKHMEHLFVAGSLEMLQRGGRISKAKAVIGGMLDVRPILHFVEGRIHSLENARGEKKALRRLIELMGERGVELREQTIGINFAADRSIAERLRDMIREAYGCDKFVISEVGAAIGSHAGPGTVAVFFLNQLPQELPPDLGIAIPQL